jgi:hypothetical protein
MIALWKRGMEVLKLKEKIEGRWVSKIGHRNISIHRDERIVNLGCVSPSFQVSFPRLKGLPSVSICLGNFCFHFLINGSSSFSSRSSSGNISGISSRMGYHREHLGQIITPSTISSFSSKTWSSKG